MQYALVAARERIGCVLYAVMIVLFVAPAAVARVGTHDSGLTDAELRKQLLTIAPYISLHSPLSVGYASESPAEVLHRFKQLEEIEELSMDGHVALQRAWRDVRAFLVASRNRITPAIERAMPKLSLSAADLSDDPLAAIVLLYIHACYEYSKQVAVASWQQEYDNKCQSAYRAVFPLMTEVANGEAVSRDGVRIASGFTKQNWVYLYAINESGIRLANVSIHVQLSTIDRRSSDHYYFIGEPWERNQAIPLRLTIDWHRAVGAAATTAAVVNLVSDQILISNARWLIDDHIPTAADRIMDEVERDIRAKQPLKRIIERLDIIRGAVNPYPDRAARRDALRASAQSQFDGAVNVIAGKITKAKDDLRDKRQRLEKLQMEYRNARGTQRERLERQIKERSDELRTLEANLKLLESERSDLLAGRK